MLQDDLIYNDGFIKNYMKANNIKRLRMYNTMAVFGDMSHAQMAYTTKRTSDTDYYLRHKVFSKATTIFTL